MVTVSGGFFSSDLFSIYNIVQNTQIVYPKELIISAMREYFAKDSKYHYVRDEFGFPKTPDHTDLDPEAGLDNDATTRIYIGQENRFDVKYYPAVLVKMTGSTSIPISINQEQDCVQYEYMPYYDGYGNNTFLNIPTHMIFAGSWDLKLDIDIYAEDPHDRNQISEAISILFGHLVRNQLTRSGLFIRSVNTSGESVEDYQNDKIHRMTISLDCRGEWLRKIPVLSVVEIINACFEIGHEDIHGTWTPAVNMQINYTQDISDLIAAV